MTAYAPNRRIYREFARDTILGPYIAEIPGIKQALAADYAAVAAISEATVAPPDVDGAIDAMITKGALDPKMIDTLTQFRIAEAAFDGKTAILNEIRARVTTTLEGAVQDAGPQLLRQLHTKLQNLCDKAQPALGILTNITDPQAAIEAGPEATAAWATCTDLRTQYDALRRSQRVVMKNLYESMMLTADRVGLRIPAEASDALIANLDEVWPTWRATVSAADPAAHLDHRGGIQYEVMSGKRTNDAPWPTEPVAQLIWMIRNTQLWIPTPRQLEDLWADRRERDALRSRELFDAAGLKTLEL